MEGWEGSGSEMRVDVEADVEVDAEAEDEGGEVVRRLRRGMLVCGLADER